MVESTFPAYFDHLRDAAAYYNPRCTELLPLDRDHLDAAADLVDADRNDPHREATDNVIDAFDRGDEETIRSAVRRATRERQFPG